MADSERDALIRKLALHVRPTCSALYEEAMQALAAPAEGATEAMVKRAEDYFYDNSPFSGPDFAGRAKDLPGMWEESDLIGGEADSREAGSAYANATPQPAEGDGAVVSNADVLRAVDVYDNAMGEGWQLPSGKGMRAVLEDFAATSRPAATAAVPDEVRALPERWREKKCGLSALGCANELAHAIAAQQAEGESSDPTRERAP